MRFRSSVVVASAAGSLVLLCLATAVRAQSGVIQPVSRVATLVTGAIQGVVQDEKGTPVFGAAVSALGVTTAVAYTDRTGRFELRTLPPQFDLAAGHQLQSGQAVPLASFPEGDYRLEIKVTDKIANKTLTREINFTVTPS